MSESKHYHPRLLLCHRGTKTYTVSTFYCSYHLKRSYLHVGSPAGLPCRLLDLLNKPSELITTFYLTHHAMGLYTEPLVTTPENEVSLSSGCKELILLLKETWGEKKVGLFIKSWSSHLIWDPTTSA